MVVNTAPALEALEQVNVAGDLVKKTFREIDAQGKAYTVTLNLLKSSIVGETGALIESTRAKDLNWTATTKLTDAEKGLTDVESKQIGVVSAASEIRKKAAMQELGAIEALKIRLMDLKATREQVSGSAVEGFNNQIRATQREIDVLEGRSLKGLDAGFRGTTSIVSRGSQAMFGMMLAINAVSSAAGNADNTGLGKLRTSLTQGVSSATGFAFALSVLAPSLGGVGVAVAAAAGGLIALAGYFGDVNEEAKKASEEGMKQFADAVNELTTPQKEVTKAGVEERITGTQSAIDKILGPQEDRADSRLSKRTAIGQLLLLSPGQKESLKALERQLEILQESKKTLDAALLTDQAIAEQKALTGDIIAKNLNLELTLEKQIKDLKTQAKAEDDPNKKRALYDSAEAAQTKLNDLQKTTNELKKEQAVIDKKTADEIEKRLNERLRLDKELSKSQEERLSAEAALASLLAKTTAEGIAGAYAKSVARAKFEYEETLKKIQALAKESGQVGVSTGGEMGIVPGTDADKAAKAATTEYHQKLGEARISKELEILKLNQEGVDKTVEAMNQKYELERAFIAANEADKEIREARLAALARDHEKELMDLRLGAVDKLSDALQKAFGDSGSLLIQKILMAIKMLASISGSGGGGFGSIFGLLSLIPGVGGIFGALGSLFGAVGGGDGTPAIDSGGGIPSNFGKTSFGNASELNLPPITRVSSPSSSMESMQSMKAAIERQNKILSSLELKPVIQLHGTLEGQRFLRKEMPGYSVFEKEKIVK